MSDQSSDTSRGSAGHAFGTAPVFLASLSTILGAILFLRMGYSVAHAGLFGTLWIIGMGHLVTIPTALAVAEIATNRKVEGGGAYFIIARTFGLAIGGAIGIALYFSQAVSVAFYLIAFAEAFRPLAGVAEEITGLAFDPRFVSIPATLLVAWLAYARGAAVGIRALWGVVALLAASVALFLIGQPVAPVGTTPTLTGTVSDPDGFWIVFAIIFPAFTGMAAGVGLSGDLANPRRAIPAGVLSATLAGLAVYAAVAFKLWSSASVDQLAGDQLIMARIAVWGPIVPIGLAAATLSSAIGSILIAPRTLQAIGGDDIMPSQNVNRFLAQGAGDANEPQNATVVTSVLILFLVAVGSIDAVARVISMVFMVTYGALCAISFLEHFAARPSYRPSFKSKWYLSLLGSLMSVFLMFQMDPGFALLSIVLMVSIYFWIKAKRGTTDLAAIFQGVMTQATRYSQVKLQTSVVRQRADTWRPSLIMVNGRTFERSAPLQFMTWLCHRYGFGTYLHFIEGRLDDETYRRSRAELRRLIELARSHRSPVYVDTMVSPSMRSALAQALQVPGVSGLETNAILLEFAESDEDDVLREVADGSHMASSARVSSLVLRHGEHFFGARSQVHIWLTWHDSTNANLMILLAYILLGHPDWQRAEIRIFAAFPHDEVAKQQSELEEMIVSGRLPISRRKVQIIPTDDSVNFDHLVATRSADADLVVLGFTDERLRNKGIEIFRRHATMRDTLFVSAKQRIPIA